VLFIDELHTIVGAGGAEGAMDASNILKPALSRGEIQCVGATTMDEYRKHIEKDAALERRFQSILVAPPTRVQAVEILKGLRYKYEEHHHVRYSDAALETAVTMSDRYITGRFLPDKAIDVIDEAGARARIATLVRPPDLSSVEKEIEDVERAKVTAVEQQQFEEAAALRDQEKNLRAKLQATLDRWAKERADHVVTIDAESVRQVIAKMSGVPLQRIEEGEASRLLDMETHLQAKVVGQGEAVGVICRALRRSRAELKDPRRPIGSFIFLGPTGVGKTYLAKVLAEFMFGDPDALIRLDMSEYMEKFNVSRLIGSPPGYVGHDEGGQLTERVRRRPYSVVLFDEIEKAHPDVTSILLQILEEGQLTDNVGYRVDFRNTVVVMTSNVGAVDIQRAATMGFAAGPETAATDYAKLKERLEDSAKKFFRPEFMNRVDEVVVFRQLAREDLLKVVDLEVEKIRARLAEREIDLVVDDAASAFLVDVGYRPEYGARQLRRTVERYIEDPLSEQILKGTYRGRCRIHAVVEDGKLVFQARKLPARRNAECKD
jgi:ATP-dependent Clp protease ATP-binding subunit ClpC